MPAFPTPAPSRPEGTRRLPLAIASPSARLPPLPPHGRNPVRPAIPRYPGGTGKPGRPPPPPTPGPYPPRPPIGPALVSGGTLCLGVSLPLLGPARRRWWWWRRRSPRGPCSRGCCAWVAGPGVPPPAGSACSCGRCWAAARPPSGPAAWRSGRCTAQVNDPSSPGWPGPGFPTASPLPPGLLLSRPTSRPRQPGPGMWAAPFSPQAGRPEGGPEAGYRLRGCRCVQFALSSLSLLMVVSVA